MYAVVAVSLSSKKGESHALFVTPADASTVLAGFGAPAVAQDGVALTEEEQRQWSPASGAKQNDPTAITISVSANLPLGGFFARGDSLRPKTSIVASVGFGGLFSGYETRYSLTVRPYLTGSGHNGLFVFGGTNLYSGRKLPGPKVGLGGKWTTRSNLVMDVNAGVNMPVYSRIDDADGTTRSYDISFVPTLSVSLGYTVNGRR